MNKIFLVFLLSILFQNITAQKAVFEFKPDFDKQVYSTHPIVNNQDNELVILFNTKNAHHAFVFNSDFEEISKINFEKFPKKINEFLGYTIQGGNYNIIFKNPASTKFAMVSINFKEKTSSQKIIDFNLKSEKLLDAFNFKNKLHLVSTKTHKAYSKSFNIYVYEDGNFKQHSISINGENDKDPYKNTSYSILVPDIGDGIKVINNKIPNSIFESTSKAKLYINEESFVFTFDKENDNTRILSIDPKSFEVKRNLFYHSKKMSSKIRKSNSYIFEDKLFQSASSSDFLKLTITDLNTNTLIKEFFVHNIQEIYFKNGPINQYKTDLLGGNKELNTSRQFLRKISKGKQGISVFKANDNYKVLIGSIKPYNYSGGSGWNTGYNASGQVTTQYNYVGGSTYDEKTVWINSILDEDLNHKKGEVEDFIPARILNFEKNTSVKKKSMFTLQNKMYRGVFIPSLNTYKIHNLF